MQLSFVSSFLRGGESSNPGQSAAQIAAMQDRTHASSSMLRGRTRRKSVAMDRWLSGRTVAMCPAALGLRGGRARPRREKHREYLQEEGRDLVSEPELDEVLRGVDELGETAIGRGRCSHSVAKAQRACTGASLHALHASLARSCHKFTYNRAWSRTLGTGGSQREHTGDARVDCTA